VSALTDNLATFDHRYAMRHVRTYPHPIARVFQAVSSAAELDVWMLPFCEVDARLGGAWSMTFGNARGEGAVTGKIVAFDPPRLIDYGGMRFELEEAAGGTKLTFIHSFAPTFVHPPGPGATMPGGDEPAPGTPWRPGFVAGFHHMLDGLGDYIEDRAKPQPMIDGKHASYHGHHDDSIDELVAIYRAIIRDTIPPA
jgi:uncharacterized protein YndB with AHSA1/START domain